MTTAAAETERTEPVDRAATLQQAARRFTTLYERNAYSVYNLALRITCDRGAAMEATKSAFLMLASSSDPDAELERATVAQALSKAPQHPTPSGAGDEKSQRMLEATTPLAPPQRAGLALRLLAGLDGAEIAELLGLSDEAAARIFHRGLAHMAGSEDAEAVARVEAEYLDWMWAEPPPELWEDLYQRFHKTIERRFAAGNGTPAGGAAVRDDVAPPADAPAEQPTVSADPTPTAATNGHAVPRTGLRARLPHPHLPALRRPSRRTLLIALALVVLIGGGVAAAAATGVLGGGHHNGLGAPPPPSLNYPKGKLSPAQLDRMRMRELHGTSKYLSRLDRKRHAKELAIIARAKRQARRLAERRRRAKALRKKRAALIRKQRADQIRAQRQAAQRQAAGGNPVPTTPPPTAHKSPSGSKGSGGGNHSSGGSKSSGGGGNGSDSSQSQSCLFSPDTGTYTCPQ